MTEHVWTYEYENDGNGHFAEWWALFRNGERIGQISTNEDDAKMVVARLNATWKEKNDALRETYKRIQDADSPDLKLPVDMTVAMAEMTVLLK